MKKILFASIALALGLASCTKDGIKEQGNSKGQASGNMIVTASTDGTRTTIDGLSVTWKANDAIYVWDGSGTGAVSQISLPSDPFTLIDGATTKKGVFSGTLSGRGAGLADRTLYATYPTTGGATKGNLTGTLAFDLPVEQTQEDNSDILGQYLYMFAEPVLIADADPTTTPVNFKFINICAVLDFPITGINATAGEHVTQVYVKGEPVTYTNTTVDGGTAQNHPTTAFMNRMQIARTTTVDGGVIFGNVTYSNTQYFSDSVGVVIANQVGTDVTAKISVIPRDMMADIDGNPVCNPLPSTGDVTTRDLTIRITTMDAAKTTRIYRCEKVGVNTHFKPGKRYTFEPGAANSKIDLTTLPYDEYPFVPPTFAYDPVAKTATIASPSDLASLAVQTNLGALSEFDGFADWTVTVTTPTLDLSTVSPWTAIGTTKAPFLGTFEGNSVEVSNLVLKSNVGANQGLFGCAGNVATHATINYIDIQAPAGESLLPTGPGASMSGALLGAGYNVTISHCTLTGTTGQNTMTHGGPYTGALVGTFNCGTIEFCTVDNVTSTSSGYGNNSLMVGGITTSGAYTGGVEGSKGDVLIKNCTVKNSNLNSAANSATNGGIVGSLDNIKTTIQDCEVNNTVIYSSAGNIINGLGAIVGQVGTNNDPTGSDGSLITRCKAIKCTLTLNTGGTIGGIAGSLNSASAVTNCWTDSQTTVGITANAAASSAGGIVGNTGNVQPMNASSNIPTNTATMLIMGCYNAAKVSGGNSGAANGVGGGICGYNMGLIVGCKNNGAVFGSMYSGGIAGMNAGAISGCCTTDVAITTGTGAAPSGFTKTNSIIAPAAAPAAAPGTIENCYFAALGGSTQGTALDFADVATVWPIAGAGWNLQPTVWGTNLTISGGSPTIVSNYVTVASLGWTTPWIYFGTADTDLPKLSVE